MYRRSGDIAIYVAPDRFEEAIVHYKTLFRVAEGDRSDDAVELRGTNFTIWIEKARGSTGVYHEWFTCDGAEARRLHETSGATITGSSSSGFYVEDQFGLSYHVFVEEEPEG